MIKRIQQEKLEEETKIQKKKEKERVRQAQVLLENLHNREHIHAELVKEKEQDRIQQQKY